MEMLLLQGVLKRRNSTTLKNGESGLSADTSSVRSEFLQEWGQVITGILVGFIVILLCTHRCWPMSCKCSDFLFAGDHYIGDGHAKRMLDSRLGAAFTLSLPFVLGIFGVRIFGADNTLITDGLVPGISLNPKLDSQNSTLFNELHIYLQSFALVPGVDCNGAMSMDTTQAADMSCRIDTGGVNITVDDSSVGTVCKLKATCEVSGNLALSSVLLVSLPEVFQSINYTIRADSWNGVDADTVVGDVFGPGEGKALVGSKDKPSQVNFELTRSRYSDIRRTGLWDEEVSSGVAYRYGLQLTKLKKALVEGSSAMESQVHYVALNFEASDNIYTIQYSDQQTFTSQISSLFTLLLSFLALFRFVKSYTELMIDNAYVYLCERRDVPLPEDVHHRTCVLEERLGELGDGGVKGMGRGFDKRKKRASRRMSAFLFQEEDKLEKEVELVSIENPMGRKVDSGSGEEMHAMRARLDLLQEQVTYLLQSNQDLSESNQQLTERVTLLERNCSGGNKTGKSEIQEETLNVNVKSAQLPTGWEEFKDDKGRSYYVGPGGESRWERPVVESACAINKEGPSLSGRRRSIGRNSIVGKRRGSMRVVAASLAKTDTG